jgi:hypothetical protein
VPWPLLWTLQIEQLLEQPRDTGPIPGPQRPAKIKERNRKLETPDVQNEEQKSIEREIVRDIRKNFDLLIRVCVSMEKSAW